MKKIFKFAIITAVLITGLAGCGDEDKPENGNDNTTKTTLTINNLSDYNDLEFFFGDSDLFEIKRGQEVTKKVNAGTGYIYVDAPYMFSEDIVDKVGFSGIRQLFEVKDVFTCEEGKNNKFDFTNTTIVTISGGLLEYEKSGGLQQGTLDAIFSSMENYFIHRND
jgi:hypothetical protein